MEKRISFISCISSTYNTFDFLAAHTIRYKWYPTHQNANLAKCVGFLESLWRDVDMKRLHRNPSDDLNFIIVSHGLALRVFLMKWFKWTVEQFEYLNNLGNCECRVLQLGDGGEYTLAVHHTDEEMSAWGLSPEMIADQKWRVHASRGDWNEKCPWYLDAFFDPLHDSDDSTEEDEHDNNTGDPNGTL